jgi:hypothetical protein
MVTINKDDYSVKGEIEKLRNQIKDVVVKNKESC